MGARSIFRLHLHIYFAFLVCVVAPFGADSNYLEFEGPGCANGTIKFEDGESRSPRPCQQSISLPNLYIVNTATLDPPSQGWKTKPYVNFNSYSDANCNSPLSWFRRELSSTSTHYSAFGPAYAKCELSNGVETYFEEEVSDGTRNNVYQTHACLLDVNIGNRYYIVTCVRSSTSSVIFNPPGAAGPPSTNGTAVSIVDTAFFWCFVAVAFFLFFF